MITGPQARELGLKIVLETPAGIGPTEIGKKILALHPDMVDDKGRPSGTIRGAVWDLDRRFPAQIKKSANGFAPIDGASLPEEISCQSPKTTDASSAASAKKGRTNAGSAGTSSVTTAATAPTQPSSGVSGANRATRTKGPILNWQNQAATAGWVSREEIQEAKLKMSALEDAVSRFQAEIKNRDDQLVSLAEQTRQLEKENREYQLSAQEELEPDLVSPLKIRGIIARLRNAAERSPVGVIGEAQNASVLVDIRQAVLAGSDEGTLDAVRRVVDDLARVRTQLALTGIRDDAKRLKAARKAAGVLQRTLGNKLGYTGRSVIDLIERDMVPLSKHPKVLSWVQKVEAKYADPVRH